MADALEQFLNKRKSRAQEYDELIEDMLGSGDYEYAESTLADILRYIRHEENITDAQIQAIKNIYNAPSAKPPYDWR